jgi:flagellar basal-body rod modification protein FlgD
MDASAVGTADQQTKSSVARKSLAEDMDAFLLLLTTQLKHQDPLSPLKPTEFTQQLVAFAGVEQQINTNSNLESLLTIQNSNFAASVVGFIGTEVESKGNVVPLQDGQAELTYNLSDNASLASISISDSNGNLVRVQQVDGAAGDHSFVWDGLDQNGVKMPDGPYRVAISATGPDKDVPIDTSVVIKGRVTGVSLDNGAYLDVGGVTVALENVKTINEPNAAEEPPAP